MHEPRAPMPGTAMDDPLLRPFSPLQWQFAISSLTVHFVAACRKPLSRAETTRLAGDFVALAPQLRLSVRTDRLGHRDPGRLVFSADGRVSGLEGLVRHRAVDSLAGALGDHLTPCEAIYENPDMPAFRVRGDTLANAEPKGGISSIVSMTLAHTLFDGADLVPTLRGEKAGNAGFEDHNATGSMSRLASMALWGLAAVMVPFYLAFAALRPRSPADFRFAALSLENEGLQAAFHRHGVSRTAMLLGLIAHSLHFEAGRARSMAVMHMRLPEQRLRGEEDRFLRARMERLTLSRAEGPTQLAAGVEAALNRNGPGRRLMPFLTSRMLHLTRTLKQSLPFLVTSRLKGYSPAELIFSVLPPLSPAGPFEAFADGVLFAGVCSGSTPGCVVLTGPRKTTLTFWIEASRAEARLPALTALLSGEGIKSQIWL